MRRILSSFICIVILIAALSVNVQAESDSINKQYTSDDFYNIAAKIIDWKKQEIGTNGDYLICDKYLEKAGTTACDWYVIGMARLGIKDDYSSYLAVVKENIKSKYTLESKLSKVKSTEWHRAILTVNACRGNAEDLLGDGTINLVSDGIYNRGLTASLGKQGINGWIWGLIALNNMNYDIPENSYYTKEDIIKEIVSRQLSDGGFALSGKTGDPDITAMAIQALAPYYKNKNCNYNIDSVVDNAVMFLSRVQLENGGFQSFGTRNSESIAQVIIALCAINIDIQNDRRFIKNNNTMLDAIMSFRMNDGGFIHSFDYDNNNPESQPDKSNSMAGEQVLLAMAALYRYENNMNSLYDFTDINSNNIIDKSELTENDILFIHKSLDNVTSQDYSRAVSLLSKANNKDYQNRLNNIILKSDEIKNIIDTLNNDIYNVIYPLDKIGVSQRNSIEDLFKRYNSLSDIDKKYILYYDDLVTAKIKAESSQRSVIIMVILIIITIILALIVITRIRSRKKKNSLSDLYPNDEE